MQILYVLFYKIFTQPSMSACLPACLAARREGEGGEAARWEGGRNNKLYA